VSMYDHLVQRGYARNVPGAPMCGCVEQMPVVTRADCTEITVTEDVTFTYNSEDGLRAEISNTDIQFNACQGANNNNNDLGAYYERLVNEEKISEEKRDAFEEIVVGETYCREAIDEFLDSKGLSPKPQCKYGWPSECGCAEVQQADYRGDVAVTKSGKECQRWDSQTPHNHSRTRERYPNAGLVDNYCRNPDGEPGGAWCYTTDPDVRWEYCHVDVCGILPTNAPTTSPTGSRVKECSYLDDQSDYRGEISVTEEGLECQRWDSQTPHSHSRTTKNYPNSGLEENYCRNPDGEPRSWCYTNDKNKRWQYCDVPRCEVRKRQLRGLQY